MRLAAPPVGCRWIEKIGINGCPDHKLKCKQGSIVFNLVFLTSTDSFQFVVQMRSTPNAVPLALEPVKQHKNHKAAQSNAFSVVFAKPDTSGIQRKVA